MSSLHKSLYKQIKGDILGKNVFKIFAAMIILGIVNLGLNSSSALMEKYFVDAFIQKNMKLFITGLVLGIVSLLTTAFILPLARKIVIKISAKCFLGFKKKFFTKLMKLPFKELEKRSMGEFLTRINGDIDNIESLFKDRICFLICNVITGIGSMIIIISLNLKLALLSIGLCIIGILWGELFKKPSRTFSEKIRKSNEEIVSDFEQGITLYDDIKINTYEKTILEKFETKNNDFYKISSSKVWLDALFQTISRVIFRFNGLGLIIIGIYFKLINKSTLSDLMAIMALTDCISGMVYMIINFKIGIQDCFVSAERVFNIINIQDEHLEKLKNTENGTITAEKLYFAYNEKDVLKNINFSIKKGEFTAFAGPSGGGKSTIFKLFLNLYNPSSGKLYIEGNNIEKVGAAVRKDIAYVSQEVWLLNDTVMENIRLGRLSATNEEVIEAAKKACIYDFVSSLENGFMTTLGDMGQELSGGQKQRINIARAILSDASIILLDEPTSALDSETEKCILDSINYLRKEKTVIMITHRLSTIEDADNIYIIDQGTVAEHGSHKKLLEEKGLYYKLCSM